MENKHTTLELSHHRLLPADEQCYSCRRDRSKDRRCSPANILKTLTVLIVLAACATSVTCAVYCYRTLNQVQDVRADIFSVHDSINANVGETAPVASKLSSSKSDSLDDISIDDFDDDEDDADDETDNDMQDDDDDDDDEDDDDFDEDDDESQEIESEDSDYPENDDYDNDDDDDDEEDEYEYDDAGEDEDDIGSENEGAQDFMDFAETLEQASGLFPDDEDFGRVRRSAETYKREGGNKPKRGKTQGRTSRAKKGKKGRKGGKGGKKLKSLLTAQFSANITEKDLMIAGVGYDAYNLKHTPLRIFKKETWVDDKKSPVSMDGRKFKVKSDGAHLVYAQVLFEGSFHPVSASITRDIRHAGDRQQRMTCTNDCINNVPGSPQIFKCTCSIFGLMHLKRNDMLYFEINNGYNNIIFEESATYMGVVQLNRD